MKGDYSRITFDPRKSYSGVLMQQGRVQTDADLNEQFELTRHRMETEVRDFIGQSGIPEETPGFQIGMGDTTELTIGSGRLYIEGMLVENEQADLLYTKQADYPVETAEEKDGVYLVYMDASRRYLTALEAPDIRDAALGSQDTSARLQNLWQIKRLRLGDAHFVLNDEQKTLLKPGRGWTPATETGKDRDRALSTGQLKAQVLATGNRVGNQLYRVEIHTPGTAGTATYKWSRNNAAFAARVVNVHDKVMTLQPVNGEIDEIFSMDDWVEISHDLFELRGQSGILARVSDLTEETLTVSLENGNDEQAWTDEIVNKADQLRSLHARVRRWNSAEAAGTLQEGQWLPIEQGIQIQFSPSGDSPCYYKAGDYWLIPSRKLLDEQIYWPRNEEGEPLFEAPQGIQHVYTCLALAQRSSGTWTVLDDLRVPFKSLVKGVLSKDGDTATGDMIFEKSVTIDGNLGIGTKEPLSRLDVNGDISAEIIYARSVRAAKFEGGIEQVINDLKDRIKALEEKIQTTS